MKAKAQFKTESRTRREQVLAIKAELLSIYMAAVLPGLLLWVSPALAAQDFRILLHFDGVRGANPWTGLVVADDTLYGTAGPGRGTVFKVNSDGSGHTILHSFNGSDGEAPYGDLALSGSTLYGTTYVGASLGGGTVFKVNRDGSGFVVLRNFASEGTGGGKMSNPKGGVVVSGTTLYGSTFNGAIFKLNTDGSGFTDLNVPYVYGMGGTLALSGTTLYGMPFYSSPFKVNTDGSSFTYLCPISHVTGGLTLSGTVLYGTAIQYDSAVKGFAFKVNTDGSGYAILHTFGPSSNEGKPYAGMALTNRVLFGTTSDGGNSGLGTVFALNADGSDFGVWHTFSGADGSSPYSVLTLSGTNLYGTTVYGGAYGAGVVFCLSLGPPTIVDAPSNQIATIGSTVEFAVSAAGPPPFHYQWLFNETNAIPAATNAVLQLASLQFSHAGTYAVVVTNAFGTVTSLPAFLNMIPAEPNIVSSPQTQTTEAGSTVRLAVRATGTSPLVYQWLFNSSNDLHFSNSALELADVRFSQSGLYTVTVSNSFGSVTSTPVGLQVIAPVSRRIVPAIGFSGPTGTSLNIDQADTLGPGTKWSLLSSVSLSGGVEFYFDVTEPLPIQRFYRAWQSGTLGYFPVLSVSLAPAISLTGVVGGSIRVDYINAIGPTDTWVPLTTVTLSNTPQLFFDTSANGQPRRHYRLIQLP